MKRTYTLALVIALAFICGCTKDQTEHASADGSVNQNAVDAEKAEEKLAQSKDVGGKAKDKSKSKSKTKVAKHDAKTKTSPASKVASAAVAPTSVASAKKATTEGATTATATVAKKRAPASENIPGSSYIVQIGAFHDKANADRLEQQLKTQGYPVVERQLDHSKNGHLYLVHLEPFSKRADADTWTSKLKEKNISAQLIVHSATE